MELMGIVHMCKTAASTPPTSSIARPVHNQLDMNHHVGEEITGRPYLHDMLVSRFVGASVASAVRWVDAWLDRWLSCYPLPGKSSAQVGKPYSSGEARIDASSRQELAALSGRFFWVGDFVQILCGRRTVFHFGPIF